MKNTMVEIFKNEQFGEIRVVECNGEPWFVAVDVCKSLDVANPSQAIARLDDDERAMFNIGRQGDTNCVNEPGLYSLVLGSRKPEAKVFKRWIIHEVIPSIRKTGGYVANDELFINTYLPFADESTKALFRVTLHTINEQNKKIAEVESKLEEVTLQNRVLSGEMLQWDEGPLLNALVRKYGNVACGDNFGKAWKAFYKELLYKHSIGLEQRKTLDVNNNPNHKNTATYKYLTVSEFPLAIQAIVAMCVDAHVDIDDILRIHLREAT